MCWVGLFAGKVIEPFWLETKMNNHVYNDLMKNNILPKLRQQATRQQMWYMQEQHVIQLKTTSVFSTYSSIDIRFQITQKVPVPPLAAQTVACRNFFLGVSFAAYIQIQADLNPDMKVVGEDFVECIDPAIIRKTCASARKRSEMMISENGGKFEHKKTALKPLMDGDH